MKKARVLVVAALAAAGLLGAGCLVTVESVADQRPAFRQARAEAQRVQGRPGPAHEINVLVFDRDEGKLVRVSLPMWLARKIESSDGPDPDLFAGDGDGDKAERVLRKLRWRDVEKAGLGILVEVVEDRGDEVLVWLK